jgi:EamA domain-containing membrane protein RarD
VAQLFSLGISAREATMQNPFRIDEGARRMIFAGVPCGLLCMLLVASTPLDHLVGDKVWIWGFCVAAGILAALGLVAYRAIPRRLILPLGIVGWIIAFGLLFVGVTFGPGAFGYTEPQW